MSASFQVDGRKGKARLRGARCSVCGYPFAPAGPICPACGADDVFETQFGPSGVVVASTVVRIPVADRQPPFALAYVDLDSGPRVLVHTSLNPPPPGSRVRLTNAAQATVEPVP